MKGKLISAKSSSSILNLSFCFANSVIQFATAIPFLPSLVVEVIILMLFMVVFNQGLAFLFLIDRCFDDKEMSTGITMNRYSTCFPNTNGIPFANVCSIYVYFSFNGKDEQAFVGRIEIVNYFLCCIKLTERKLCILIYPAVF